MEDDRGSGTEYRESQLRSDSWHIPNNKIEIWQTTVTAGSSNSTEPSTAGLYELGAVDFSQPTEVRKTAAEYSKRDNQTDQADQTVTLFDLNQNHETKVIATDVLVDCESRLTTPDDDETTSLSSSSVCEGHASNTPCVVCGDKSSGKHYGQLTCEGCKSFFKRSVRRNLSYTCRGNRDCAIDPQHRNQCQYCRLHKCVKAGMRREAVQRGRINPTPHMDYPYPIAPILPGVDTSRINSCYNSNFISLLLRAEPYTSCSLQQGASGIPAPGEGIYELTARLCFTAIEWARNIQFFVELHIMDQVSLLRSCWAELFILNTAQCCSPIYIRSLLAAVSSSAAESRYDVGSTSDMIRQLQDQFYRFSVLRLDAPEYCCLKALVLFSPDAPALHDPISIQNLQDKVLASLEEYDRIQHGNQIARTGHLLLRLPALKLINPTVVENLFFTSQAGKTPIDNVIKDMLVGGNNFWIPPNDQGAATPNTSHAGSMSQPI